MIVSAYTRLERHQRRGHLMHCEVAHCESCPRGFIRPKGDPARECLRCWLDGYRKRRVARRAQS